jgi:hypothetical protein
MDTIGGDRRKRLVLQLTNTAMLWYNRILKLAVRVSFAIYSSLAELERRHTQQMSAAASEVMRVRLSRHERYQVVARGRSMPRKPHTHTREARERWA